MKCPVDGTQLMMTERSGVEIDYCPQCRGVWLDRGELDKILEKAVPAVTLPEPGRQPPRQEDYREPRRDDYREPRREENREEYRGDRRPYHGDDDGYRKKKRRSLLDDIFDF